MKRATPIVLVLFTLSGVSGLIYEIVWIRMLSHLLGGTSYAISTVLAAFMGGLALGSRFYGRRADRVAHPLRLYGLLELGIAALGALVYLLIRAAPPAYVAVAGAIPGGTLGLLRIVVAGALILPPTFLMGGTLPVLSRFIVHRRDRVGRGLGVLYAVNTFGAVLGSFLTGFVLIATLGHLGSTALAVAVNALIGLTVLMIDHAVAPVPVEDAADPAAVREPPKKRISAPADETPEIAYGVLATIFALSGFASLGYELYWTRALQHFLGNSTYAFSAMLTTFLLGLAAGGWVGGRLADRVRSPARLLGWAQLLAGVFAMASVVLIWEWLPRLNDSQWLRSVDLPWRTYLVRRFLAAFAVMALPTFCTGMTFPIVNRIWIRRLDHLGRGVGGLYFANTLGSIAGSLAAGFVVLPLLGAKGALIVTAVFSVALGAAAHVANRRRVVVDAVAAVVVVGLLAAAGPSIRSTGRVILSDMQGPADVVLFSAEDHAAETRVYRKPSGEMHMSVDGHSIGGTEPNITRKEKILAHLPMVLRPDAKHTLSVGLGSGITLGTLAMYPELNGLVCVEIVPGVVDGARYFTDENHDVLEDPRLELIVGDGVQYLLTTRDRFDIISSDSKLNPEYAGNAPLLSRDYYRLCRDRLTDDGVMVQWLGVHLPLDDIRVIVRGFADAFPYVSVYWYDPANIVLAGSKAPIVLDFDAARRNSRREVLGDDLASLQLDDPYALASLWLCDRETLLQLLGPGPTNTWERPIIEFTMGRHYLQKPAQYHEDDTLGWLASLHGRASERLSGEFDPDVLRRYSESAKKLLDGFAMGGGIMRLQNALPSFKSALQENPDDPRLQNVVSKLEKMGGDIEEALATGQMNTVEGLVQAGMLRVDQGRSREAIPLFDRALAMRPDDPNIQYNRMIALKGAGEMATFRSELARFLAEFPKDGRGYSLQGREQASAGDFEAAVVSFRRACELDPGNAVFLNNLAAALARLERYGEAGRAFAAVCERNPRFQNAAYFAAASFSMANELAEAAKWARYCVDEGLSSPDKFATDPFFANLRASEYWDAARNRLADRGASP